MINFTWWSKTNPSVPFNWHLPNSGGNTQKAVDWLFIWVCLSQAQLLKYTPRKRNLLTQ